MRIFFLGAGPLAERAFERLTGAFASQLHVVATCSNALPEQGWWHSARIARWSEAQRIPFVANANRDEALLLETVQAVAPDLLLSVQHPWVISPAVLDAVKRNALNLHTAPLPEYGGFNGVSHAILDGAAEYGVDLHWMRDDVDAGPVLLAERFGVPPASTAQSLHALTAEAGLRVLVRLFDLLASGADLPNRDGPTRPVRVFGRSSLDRYREIVDPSDEDEVDRKSRAFFFPPFAPAYVVANGVRTAVIPKR